MGIVTSQLKTKMKLAAIKVDSVVGDMMKV